MMWDWDFIRGRKTAISNRQQPTDQKLIMVNGHAHEIQGANLSDMEVGAAVRMLYRSQWNHESICTLARDRIVYLADRLGEIEASAVAPVSQADITAGAAAIVDIWSGGDKAWRSSIHDSDFLESADWLKAMELSRAVLSARGRNDG